MSSMSRRRAFVPVLYVGEDLTRSGFETLRAHRIGVIVTEDAARAQRLLSHFRVAAIVVAVPNLNAIAELARFDIPVIVLAARNAKCDLEMVTVLRRGTDAVELAAVIHGIIRREPRQAARNAA